MQATHVQFTPSAGVLIPVSPTPQMVTLPAADPGNAAVVLHNTGAAAAAIVAGGISGTVFNAPGAITLQPGEMRLVSHPGLTGGTLATVQTLAGMPTTAEGMPLPNKPAALSFTRGKLADVWMFPAPAAAVL